MWKIGDPLTVNGQALLDAFPIATPSQQQQQLIGVRGRDGTDPRRPPARYPRYVPGLPEPALLALMLAVEPEELQYVCSLNKQTAAMCRSNAFMRAYALKHASDWDRQMRLWLKNENHAAVDKWLPMALEDREELNPAAGKIWREWNRGQLVAQLRPDTELLTEYHFVCAAAKARSAHVIRAYLNQPQFVALVVSAPINIAYAELREYPEDSNEWNFQTIRLSEGDRGIYPDGLPFPPTLLHLVTATGNPELVKPVCTNKAIFDHLTAFYEYPDRIPGEFEREYLENAAAGADQPPLPSWVFRDFVGDIIKNDLATILEWVLRWNPFKDELISQEGESVIASNLLPQFSAPHGGTSVGCQSVLLDYILTHGGALTTLWVPDRNNAQWYGDRFEFAMAERVRRYSDHSNYLEILASAIFHNLWGLANVVLDVIKIEEAVDQQRWTAFKNRMTTAPNVSGLTLMTLLKHPRLPTVLRMDQLQLLAAFTDVIRLEERHIHFRYVAKLYRDQPELWKSSRAYLFKLYFTQSPDMMYVPAMKQAAVGDMNDVMDGIMEVRDAAYHSALLNVLVRKNHKGLSILLKGEAASADMRFMRNTVTRLGDRVSREMIRAFIRASDSKLFWQFEDINIGVGREAEEFGMLKTPNADPLKVSTSSVINGKAFGILSLQLGAGKGVGKDDLDDILKSGALMTAALFTHPRFAASYGMDARPAMSEARMRLAGLLDMETRYTVKQILDNPGITFPQYLASAFERSERDQKGIAFRYGVRLENIVVRATVADMNDVLMVARDVIFKQLSQNKSTGFYYQADSICRAMLLAIARLNQQGVSIIGDIYAGANKAVCDYSLEAEIYFFDDLPRDYEEAFLADATDTGNMPLFETVRAIVTTARRDRTISRSRTEGMKREKAAMEARRDQTKRGKTGTIDRSIPLPFGK